MTEVEQRSGMLQKAAEKNEKANKRTAEAKEVIRLAAHLRSEISELIVTHIPHPRLPGDQLQAGDQNRLGMEEFREQISLHSPTLLECHVPDKNGPILVTLSSSGYPDKYESTKNEEFAAKMEFTIAVKRIKSYLIISSEGPQIESKTFGKRGKARIKTRAARIKDIEKYNEVIVVLNQSGVIFQPGEPKHKMSS